MLREESVVQLFTTLLAAVENGGDKRRRINERFDREGVQNTHNTLRVFKRAQYGSRNRDVHDHAQWNKRPLNVKLHTITFYATCRKIRHAFELMCNCLGGLFEKEKRVNCCS